MPSRETIEVELASDSEGTFEIIDCVLVCTFVKNLFNNSVQTTNPLIVILKAVVVDLTVNLRQALSRANVLQDQLVLCVPITPTSLIEVQVVR